MPTVEQVRAALESVKDPEFDLGILEMGLVYDIAVSGEAGERVTVLMTLTSPMCPHVGEHTRDVIEAVQSIDGVRHADVQITFTPPWDPKTMATDNFKALVGLW